MDSSAPSTFEVSGRSLPGGGGSDVDALEAELRSRLSGHRLVCEIGFDGSLHRRLVEAMTLLRERGVAWDAGRLGARYAAITAAYLVAEGIFRYECGNFWGNLEVEGIDQRVLGQAFERAIRHLQLETFERIAEEERALRFLTPILAHGGIPKYSLADFFHVLLDELRRGAGDAAEVIARWRASKSRFVNVDRPVERFLLYGGNVSLDLVERCIDMVRECPSGVAEIDPVQFGLPRYICEAYAALEEQVKRLASTTRNATPAPRPSIVIDPYSASGPMLLLPAAYGEYTNGSWSVVAGSTASRYRVAREDRLVPIGPAMEWTVELFYPSGARARSFTFTGLGRHGVLLFDEENGRLVGDPGRLRSPHVWLLSPQGDEGRPSNDGAGRLSATEEAPPPAGAWDGYQLAAYDLTGVSRLTFGGRAVGAAPGQLPGSAAGVKSLWVRVQRTSIRLVGDPIDGVQAEFGGAPVYSSMPRLNIEGLVASGQSGSARWFARVECGGRTTTFDGAELARRSDGVLDDVLAAGQAGEVHLYVRGALGSDFRATFCIIPGLSVDRPRNLLVPGRSGGAVTIATVGAPARRYPIPEGAESIVCDAAGAEGESVRLRVLLPCLQWAAIVASGDRGALGQVRVQLPAASLGENEPALLVVRTRCPRLPLVLRLYDGERVLQEERALAAGEEGRWTFDLRRFSDTVRHAECPALQLKLYADDRLVHVGDIRSDLEVTDIQAVGRTVPGHTSINLRFKQGRVFKQRVARLWSLSLPWRTPLQTAIADGLCEASFGDSDDNLPPGVYLAEIAVDDGWSTVRRPDRSAPATVTFRVGSVVAERAWIEHSQADPLNVLASAFVLGRVRRPLMQDEAHLIAPAALEALAVLHRHYEPGEPMVASIEAVGRLLCRHPAALAEGMFSAALDERLGHGGALLVALDLIPRLARSDVATDALDDLEQLWELCAPLAAALDLRFVGNAAVRRRIEAYLGLELPKAVKCPVVPRHRAQPPELQPFLLIPVEQLEEIRRHSGLLPRRVLDIDNQATVQLEWLVADRTGRLSARQWQAMHRGLADSLPALPRDVVEDFNAVRAPERLLAAFPEMAFPEVVHAAALHVVTGSPKAVRAAMALQHLVPVCPGLVTRSLVLATVLAHSAEL